MPTLFDPADRSSLERRLAALRSSSPRQWGKMSVSQMLAHLAISLEVSCGDRVKTQLLVGRLISPFVKASALGEKPFPRNSPTDPEYRVTSDPAFDQEKAKVAALIDRFCAAGPAAAEGRVHPFFGRMTGDEWGRLMGKHLDHHLRQFDV
jgi:hypothetical protein